jgi:hypothetical protein
MVDVDQSRVTAEGMDVGRGIDGAWVSPLSGGTCRAPTEHHAAMCEAHRLPNCRSGPCAFVRSGGSVARLSGKVYAHFRCDTASPQQHAAYLEAECAVMCLMDTSYASCSLS